VATAPAFRLHQRCIQATSHHGLHAHAGAGGSFLGAGGTNSAPCHLPHALLPACTCRHYSPSPTHLIAFNHTAPQIWWWTATRQRGDGTRMGAERMAATVRVCGRVRDAAFSRKISGSPLDAHFSMDVAISPYLPVTIHGGHTRRTYMVTREHFRRAPSKVWRLARATRIMTRAPLSWPPALGLLLRHAYYTPPTTLLPLLPYPLRTHAHLPAPHTLPRRYAYTRYIFHRLPHLPAAQLPAAYRYADCPFCRPPVTTAPPTTLLPVRATTLPLHTCTPSSPYARHTLRLPRLPTRTMHRVHHALGTCALLPYLLPPPARATLLRRRGTGHAILRSGMA